MEHTESFTSLVIVILAAFLTPILMHRLKLKAMPIVVAEILVGLIIGQSGFNLVHESTWLETLSTLGFIFLMFLSGLEIDFSIFASKKKNRKPNNGNNPSAFTIAVLVFSAIFILSLGLSYLFVLFGFIDNFFLMTLIISTISLGVVVPTLKEANAMKTTIGQTILLIAVIADLVTMILLAVFVSLYGDGTGNMWLLLVLFGAGVLIYFIGKYYKHRTFIETMAKGTIQIGTRAVFTLIIFLVALSETVGAENILGAFLAGTLVSLLSPNQELVQKMDSFGYGFLIPIFFVMVGVDINVRELFADPSVLILMVLLLVALFASKLVPALILKRWYDWETVLSIGMILTSTLSLVIAAATIGERLGVIDGDMESALILVAVLSCIIAPPVFKRYFKKPDEVVHKQIVTFIGANQWTLPVVRELDSSSFESHLYHTKVDKVDEQTSKSLFEIKQVPNYELGVLDEMGVFDVDVLVVSTGDEEKNMEIASFGKEQGIERVIARAEGPQVGRALKEKGIDVFSVLLSAKTLLKAFIVAPSVVDILTNEDSTLYEINMQNAFYEGILLREFPFTGDVIMVRIFRGKDSIVPHGDTELRLNDRLIVTGTPEYVEELQEVLEFQ